MPRDVRRAYMAGYAAGRNAMRCELESEFQLIRRDLVESRRHLTQPRPWTSSTRLTVESLVMH
jgi:hypothetical protein